MSCQFTFKGVTYECTGEDKDFQIKQFNHAISEQDYQTVKNRIHNQITCWDCLKVVSDDTPKEEKKEEEDKNTFW